jgi:enolase
MKNIRQIMKLANIDYFEDPDIQENFKFYHELVKDLKVLSVEDGLSNVVFKLLDEKKYKNAKLLQVAL